MYALSNSNGANAQIPHAWFYNNEPHAEKRGSNFFFQGVTIYSYGNHFPIATKVYKYGELTILFTTKSYTNTTSAHVAHTRRAIPEQTNILFCENIPENEGCINADFHAKNIKAWETQLKHAFTKIETARKKEKYTSEIGQIIEAIKKYMLYFDIAPDKNMKSLMQDANPNNFKKYLNKEAARIKAANEAEAAKEMKRINEALNKWRNFEVSTISMGKHTFDYLRVNYQTKRLETTQGIQIPFEDANKFFKHIKQVVTSGGCNGNCEGLFMKLYEIKEISKNLLHIGCHKITMKEVDNAHKLMQLPL